MLKFDYPPAIARTREQPIRCPDAPNVVGSTQDSALPSAETPQVTQRHDGSMPLVTIVTPAFNQAKFVAETIESVLAQNYPNIEYIVIDDGSTDDTAAILDRYHDRVRVVTQPNAGQALTLNRGWSQARGSILGYLSSDDILYPTAVAELVAVLEEESTNVCVFPDCDLIDPASRIVKRNVCRKFDLESLIVEQECYIGPGALFRAEAFRAVGGWRADLRLAPDREFWIRLASWGEFAFLSRTLAGYRIHPHSISYKDVSEAISAEYLAVLDRFFADGWASPAIARRRDEAYGRAYLLIARNCFRALRFSRGRANYAEARRCHPPLGSVAHRLSLLRTSISKPVRLLQGQLRSIARSR